MLAENTSAAQSAAPLMFFALAALVCVSAWAVVISQNIVRMAVYLLLTLAGVAGLYFMLEAEFLAAVQLIVYAGGTLILFIFGVMLTSKNPFMQLKVSGGELAVGILTAVLIASMLIFSLVMSPVGKHTGVIEDADYSDVATIGKGLLTSHLVAFELAAVLLLVVMIGAAYMARRRTADEIEENE